MTPDQEFQPACCHVVPVLWAGEFDTDAIRRAMDNLVIEGSRAALGFTRPEGIVVYHTAGNLLFKATLEKDDAGKRGNGA